jgi:hypothetical protein
MAACQFSFARRTTHDVVMAKGVALGWTAVSTVQYLLAGEVATAVDIVPIRVVTDDSDALVLRTDKRKFFHANTFLGVHYVMNLSPHETGTDKDIHVAKDEEAIAGTGEGNADSVCIGRETNLCVCVASNQGEKDNVVLFALIRIDCHDLGVHVSELERRRGIMRLVLDLLTKSFDEPGTLGIVKCQNGDLIVTDTILQEI